jgi:ABC-type polysaccharide/polyol phosphate export permease
VSARTTAGAEQWVVNDAPTGRWVALRPDELWRHRELIAFFALRDLKVRYKQAFLGAAWAGLQPLVGALSFTILFNRLADVEVGDGRSYFAFALVGFIVWTYVSSSLSTGSSSLLYNADLLTKVSFPKIVAPAAALLPPLLDLAVGAVLALGAALVAGDGFSPAGFAVGLPLGLVLLLLTAAGPTLFMSAVIVKYRDAAVLVTFGVQVLLFLSPVAYPPELAPEGWRTVLYLNPVAGALGLLRAALTGAALPAPGRIALSFAVAALLLVVGLHRFRSNERELADII